MGTSVGSKVFTEHGWRADASLNLAFTGFTLFILFLRGPHCPRYTWLGWQGGCELRKSRVLAQPDAGGDAAAAERHRSPSNGDKSGRDEKISAPVEVVEKASGADEREGAGIV